ncbi:hypothetical protein CEXT_34891 [Caerostris extrusa]|uniref:Uncharacterized protein n=1 Tax=Caerostris extrusa TaxID=172846 RepID=A0AAV4MEF1_CAEEX|nr:hypothetical protein CEXT_34891 [Caerostris extrusa]
MDDDCHIRTASSPVTPKADPPPNRFERHFAFGNSSRIIRERGYYYNQKQTLKTKQTEGGCLTIRPELPGVNKVQFDKALPNHLQLPEKFTFFPHSFLITLHCLLILRGLLSARLNFCHVHLLQ